MELTKCCKCRNWNEPAESYVCKECKHNKGHGGQKDNFQEMGHL